MILAKEFEGELWIKAADHNRLIKAEREAIRTRLAQPEPSINLPITNNQQASEYLK